MPCKLASAKFLSFKLLSSTLLNPSAVVLRPYPSQKLLFVYMCCVEFHTIYLSTTLLLSHGIEFLAVFVRKTYVTKCGGVPGI